MSRGWKSKPNTNVYCDSTGKSDTDRHGDSDSKWDGDTASIGNADSDGHQTDADTKGAAYTASSAHAVTVKELKKLEVTGTREVTRESLAFGSWTRTALPGWVPVSNRLDT